MFDIKKEWKTFDISLEKVEEWARINLGTEYVGNSGNNLIWFHFINEPTQDLKNAIDSQWDSVSGAGHAWATSYYPNDELESSLKLAKKDIATKPWNSLSLQQKKIIAGTDMDHIDKKQIITDHPKA